MNTLSQSEPYSGQTPSDPVGVVVYGEVLFDKFPDGKRVLGGAPFNVAWGLHGLGIDPLLISAVGDDREGREISDTMQRWGMTISGVQIIAAAPTGEVNVTLDNGQPQFDIVERRAWDFIDSNGIRIEPAPDMLLYHGSLAFRNESSRNTLLRLISDTQPRRFVDLNLRFPHFDRSWLDVLVKGATWVKLNDDELGWLTGRDIVSEDDVRSGVDQLRKTYGDFIAFVTCGTKGAYCIENESVTHEPAKSVDQMHDTVGAGDAFSAATLFGLIRQDPTREILARATRLAASVCGIDGATTVDHSLYQKVMP